MDICRVSLLFPFIMSVLCGTLTMTRWPSAHMTQLYWHWKQTPWWYFKVTDRKKTTFLTTWTQLCKMESEIIHPFLHLSIYFTVILVSCLCFVVHMFSAMFCSVIVLCVFFPTIFPPLLMMTVTLWFFPSPLIIYTLSSFQNLS